MKHTGLFIIGIICMIAACLQGCITGDYDLSKDLGAGMSFSSDGFTIAGTNSADIPLSQIIELSDSDELQVDDQGNYLFYKLGNQLEEKEIIIGQGSLCVGTDQMETFHIKDLVKPEDITVGKRSTTIKFTAGIDIDFKPDHQGKQIRDFYYIYTPMKIYIGISADGVADFTDNLSLNYRIPSFYDCEEEEHTDVMLTNEDFHEAYIQLTGVDFKKKLLHPEYEALSFNSSTGNMTMKGRVDVDVTMRVNKELYDAAADPTMSLQIMMGTLGTEKVTCRFDKTEDVSIEPITFGNLPDFIRDEEVCIDVENPVIRLTVDNNVPANVDMNAYLKSIKNEKLISSLKVGRKYGSEAIEFGGPEFGDLTPVRTSIWLTRIPTQIPDSVSKNIVISDMMTLIEKMPDRVEVMGEVTTDSSQIVTLSLGETYHAAPYYELTAPLKMGPKMQIVYSKDIETNGNLRHINVESVNFTADITNNLPLSLKFKVTPLDAGGNAVEGIRILHSDSIDAKSSMPVYFRMESDDNARLNLVERIKIKAYAKTGEKMAGQYLNKNQNLRLENANITINKDIVKP